MRIGSGDLIRTCRSKTADGTIIVYITHCSIGTVLDGISKAIVIVGYLGYTDSRTSSCGLLSYGRSRRGWELISYLDIS